MPKTKTPIKPNVPLGKPLELSDEDLDRLAEVTPGDVERIKGEVKKIAPKLSALLDAGITTNPLEDLQKDHAALTTILEERRDTIMETLPIGARLTLKMYFMMLEDAISTLRSLIEFLTPRTDQQ